jgi:Uri superfamily endonuclease
MKGSYILVAELKESKKIRVGKLGLINFKEGYYAYVGSGMKNLEKRIERHLRISKRTHWHVDYLLKHARIKDVWILKSEERRECKIARALSEELSSIEGFGSSDCGCTSHLFFSTTLQDIGELVRKQGCCKYGFEGIF